VREDINAIRSNQEILIHERNYMQTQMRLNLYEYDVKVKSAINS